MEHSLDLSNRSAFVIKKFQLIGKKIEKHHLVSITYDRNTNVPLLQIAHISEFIVNMLDSFDRIRIPYDEVRIIIIQI
jgi:hypothetical protein